MSIMADIGDKCDVIVEAGGDDCITWYGEDAPDATAVGAGRELKPLAGTAGVSNVEQATDD